MSLSHPVDENTLLEEQVLRALQSVTAGPDGTDVVTSGEVFDVVATDGVVRVLLDSHHIPDGSGDLLAETLSPFVESLPGVKRVVVKPRPRSIATRDRLPGIHRVIGIHSGKGGVGKSTVAVNLAVTLAQQGYKVGLLDADIYGPSCPTMLGISGRVQMRSDGLKIEPLQRHGVSLMSLGLLLPAGQALMWRGSLVDQGLPQLLSDVDWGELDVLLIDLPPGTSDVHLAVAQHAALSGVLTVTSPGQISVDDVRRGMEMFADVQIPCLGVVENMAVVTCQKCGDRGALFGSDGGADLAAETGVPLLASLPFMTELAVLGDRGEPLLVSDAESSIAQQFVRLATRVARSLRLSTLAGAQS
jgi:ATP-binding protein involved in chromosome partitioning